MSTSQTFLNVHRNDDKIMDTPLIMKHKDEERLSEYWTKRVILGIYDEMAEAMRTGIPYKTRLDPLPGPQAGEKGNFLPLPEWPPGHSKAKIGRPIFIHPKGCHECTSWSE